MSFWQEVREPRPLKDEERPHQLLWYLAGGRMTAELPHNGVPTAATLGERRAVEEANREAVGFWGIVRGKREVKISRKQLAEAVRCINETTEEAGGGDTGGTQKEAEDSETQKPGQADDCDSNEESQEKAENLKTEKPGKAPEADKGVKGVNETSGLVEEDKAPTKAVERECGTKLHKAAPVERRRSA